MRPARTLVALVALVALAIAACSSPTPLSPDATSGADAPDDGGSIDTSAPHDAALEITPGLGTDPSVAAGCTKGTCHADVAAKWANLSAHRLLNDCTTCHRAVADVAIGPGHMEAPTCGRCHSEATHHDGIACTACHDPHGSANAFLVREAVALLDGRTAVVHVTKPEGASLDGLVRQGVDGGVAGTGLCEVCHTATLHYTADGRGVPHKSSWCGDCHDHAKGFASP